MIARILAFLRRLFPGNEPEPRAKRLAITYYSPTRRPESETPDFIDLGWAAQSFRKGEAFDPLSATIEES